MSYNSRETSANGAQPFELYLFQTQTQTWRLTSADEAKVYQGNGYSLETVKRTNTSQSAEVKGGHIKVTIPKDHPIAQQFVSYIPSTPLSLVIYRGHDGEADSEVVTNFTGRVLSAQFTTADTCELDCAPDTEILKRNIASACFQRPCNRILFDDGCTMMKTAWRVMGTVQSISADGLTVTIAACGTKPDGWFQTGYMEKGTERRMVWTHAGTSISLINVMAGLKVGDAVYVYAGCDRTYSGANGCTTKFNNGVNFMGWEWIPGTNPFSSGLG